MSSPSLSIEQQIEQIDSLRVPLAKSSNRHGLKPHTVYAGGGNSSVETPDILAMKPSGWSLAEITPGDFVLMRKNVVATALYIPSDMASDDRERMYQDILRRAQVDPDPNVRASVETIVHYVMPQTFVMHTHPALVNMITCCVYGQELTNQLFRGHVLWVPYVKPGCTLGKVIHDLLADYRLTHDGEEPLALFLQNHGLFIGGNSPQEIDEKTAVIEQVLFHNTATFADLNAKTYFGAKNNRPVMSQYEFELAYSSCLTAIHECFGPKFTELSRSPMILNLVRAKDWKKIALGGSLTPDETVYAGIAVLPLKKHELNPSSLRKALSLYREQHPHPESDDSFPRVILVENGGMITVGKTRKAARNASIAYDDSTLIKAGAYAMGGIRYMTPEDSRFVLDWPVEKWRAEKSNV